MKKSLLSLIRIYQLFIRNTLVSMGIASDCCYLPTCSEYTKEAIIKYGVIKGLFLGIKRISRCGMCPTKKYDPVP